ncbi:MAG: hypothetical protein WD181_01945, partial [Solirubrobacterales bacterium]
ATGYLFSAYLFYLLIVLVYITILGAKFQPINRELGELIEQLKAEDAEEPGADLAEMSVEVRADPADTADPPPREESSV